MVRQQAEVGKRGWTSYVAERLGGLESPRALSECLIARRVGVQIR